ncbi:hypothetical protein [Paracoccus sp. KR1-242]|uniref:hypothetical protein n=1 Tax=Paracoccus sp. KR1-242 TaxID=3410028 RepID=UPI003C0E251E
MRAIQIFAVAGLGVSQAAAATVSCDALSAGYRMGVFWSLAFEEVQASCNNQPDQPACQAMANAMQTERAMFDAIRREDLGSFETEVFNQCSAELKDLEED